MKSRKSDPTVHCTELIIKKAINSLWQFDFEPQENCKYEGYVRSSVNLSQPSLNLVKMAIDFITKLLSVVSAPCPMTSIFPVR